MTHMRGTPRQRLIFLAIALAVLLLACNCNITFSIFNPSPARQQTAVAYTPPVTLEPEDEAKTTQAFWLLGFAALIGYIALIINTGIFEGLLDEVVRSLGSVAGHTIGLLFVLVGSLFALFPPHPEQKPSPRTQMYVCVVAAIGMIALAFLTAQTAAMIWPVCISGCTPVAAVSDYQKLLEYNAAGFTLMSICIGALGALYGLGAYLLYRDW